MIYSAVPYRITGKASKPWELIKLTGACGSTVASIAAVHGRDSVLIPAVQVKKCAGAAGIFPRRAKVNSVIQDKIQEGIDVDLAVEAVFDETQPPELVHEKIDPGPRRADHLRQRFLRYRGEYSVWLVFHPVAPEQQKCAGKALLAGVEQLIDQVLFDSDVSRKELPHEPIGEGMFRVQ